MFTIKIYRGADNNNIEFHSCEAFTFKVCESGEYQGHLETHDDQEDIVIENNDRLFVMNNESKTIFSRINNWKPQA